MERVPTMTALMLPRRRVVLAGLSALSSLAATLAAAAPIDLRSGNITSSDTRSVIAPALPVPPVGASAPPITFLQVAAAALSAGRTGETQEALERAETRLLDSAGPAGIRSTPALDETRAARSALAAHDRISAEREIDAAIAALSAPASEVSFPPPMSAPTPLQPAAARPLAASPPPAPLVTKALLPGRWELRGARYVWVPPDSHLRAVEGRPWVQGRYVWRDGAWVWVAAHYGYP
jgi:hypothetical protein